MTDKKPLTIAADPRQAKLFELRLDAVPLEPAWSALAEQALIRCRLDHSPATRATYLRHYKAWIEWCKLYGENTVMPISPMALAAHMEWYVAHQTRIGVHGTRKRQTIEGRMRTLSALDSRWRKTPEQPFVQSISGHPVVKAWWRGYCREHPENHEGAPVITRDELARVIQAMYARRFTAPREMSRARNRALLLLGYAGAFRRGELSRVLIQDVIRNARGLFVQWRRSKTDQMGKGQERTILPQGELLLCPVDAFDEWMRLYRNAVPDLQPDAPLFPVLSGPRVAGPMSEQRLYLLIRALGDAAGVKITPHSLRVSFATHAAENYDEGEVAYHGRWGSRTTLKRYIRRGRDWKNNPTSGLTNRSKPTTENTP